MQRTRRIVRICLAMVPMLALSHLSTRAGDAGMAPATDPATGYRIANYRSPVTAPIEGGRKIGLGDLDALRKQGATLVDVMPARAGYDPATGAWRLVETRDDIPGSVWLPNTGQGRLEPRLAAYLRATLATLTAGRTDHPVVIYCMADCWMSWNAVRRVARLGYTNVYWYADGTDGWLEAGRSLVRVTPAPVPALTSRPPSDTAP